MADVPGQVRDGMGVSARAAFADPVAAPVAVPLREQWTAQQACVLAQVSYRQIDAWDRAGYVTATVPATGSGSRRGYSRGDLVRLVAMARLVRAGVTTVAAARAVSRLPQEPTVGSVILASDGESVWQVDGDEIVALLSAGRALFAVEVGQIVDGLADAT